jgi:hypothetical protein
MTMQHGPRQTIARLAALVLAVALGACQQADGARESPDAAALQPPVVPAPPEATRPAPPPIPAAQALFSFETVLGVPTVKADTLAQGIGTYSRARNLTLVRRGDPTATYRVLGFLSAVGGTGDTTVSYVWDIMDTAGNRVHRITGVEIAGKGEGDPWAGVNDQVINAIAARTVEAIHAWVNQAPAGGAPPSPAAAAPMPGEAI